MYRSELLVMLLMVGVACCGCSRDGNEKPAAAKDAAAKTESRPPEQQAAPFNKELFAKVHRAAIAFDPHKTNGFDELRIELDVIRHAPKTEAENQVFNVFENILTAQIASSALTVRYEGAMEHVRELPKLMPKLRAAIGENAPLVRQDEELIEAGKAGYIAVRDKSKPNSPLACATVIEHYNLKVTEGEYHSFINYQESMQILESQIKLGLELAARVMYSGGQSSTGKP